MKNAQLFYLIVGFTLLRILVSLSNGLGVDEAHYALYGLNPDLSYFDHPPLVGWLQIPFVHLPLPWSIKARLPAMICGVLASLTIYHWLMKRAFSQFQAVWAVAGLNICLLFEGLTLFFLPDTLLLLLTPMLAISVLQLEEKKSVKNWIKLGFVLGLSALAKYTAFLFVVALAIRWVQKRYWSDFKKPGLYAGALIAAILTAPIILWNARHDWMSFKYQSGHVMSWQTLDLKVFLGAQLSQLVGLGLFYPWFLRLAKRTQAWEFERVLIFVCLGFFSFFAIFGNFLPHWTAPAFVLGIPWAIARALGSGFFTRPLKAAFIMGSALFAFLNAEMITHFLPAATTREAYRDVQGWETFVADLSRRAHNENKNLAVINWTFGSRFLLYSQFPSELFVLDQRTDQFDLWNPQSPLGKDFLIVIEAKNKAEFFDKTACEKSLNVGAVPLRWRGETLIDFELWQCDKFQWK